MPIATPIRSLAVVLLILGLMTAALPLQAQAPPGGKPLGPTDVGVVTMAQIDVPYIRSLPGRAVAFETGEI
ncbi:MAG: efflux RND transporter periplasmic adaptor subunit, partial [Pseudorhodobacter sp.]|nr:efflux RND transporter periplasmic adaptor subunit [Pseudorhodobacter sp.]